MLEQIERKGRLYRSEDTSRIVQEFGGEWAYVTDQGGLALDRRVLKSFERLTKTKVVLGVIA